MLRNSVSFLHWFFSLKQFQIWVDNVEFLLSIGQKYHLLYVYMFSSLFCLSSYQQRLHADDSRKWPILESGQPHPLHLPAHHSLSKPLWCQIKMHHVEAVLFAWSVARNTSEISKATGSVREIFRFGELAALTRHRDRDRVAKVFPKFKSNPVLTVCVCLDVTCMRK